MTKRILAIVLAVVMAMSVLAVEAFAAFNVTVSKNDAQTSITANWSAVTGAYRYVVELNRVGGSTTTQYTSNTTYTFSGLTGGTYSVRVTAQNSSYGYIDDGKSSEITLNTTGTGANNKITVTGSGSNTTVSWSLQNGATGYYVSWVAKDNSKSGGYSYSNQNSTTSHTIGIAMSDLNSITVQYYNANGTLVEIDTWRNSGTSTPGGVTGSGTGTVTMNGTTLSWTGINGVSMYVVTYYTNTSWQETTVGQTYGTSMDVTNILARYLTSTATSNSVTFNVYGYYAYNSNPTSVGSYTARTYTAGTSGTVYGVTVQGTYLYWNNANSSQRSYVTAVCNGRTILNRQDVGYVSYINLASYISSSYLYGSYPIQLTVYVGSTSVGSTYYYPSYYNGGSGTTTPGTNYNYNFRVARNGYNAVLSWNAVSGVTSYRVSWTYLSGSNTTNNMMTYDTSFTVAYGSGVYVKAEYYYNGRYYTLGAATVDANGNVSYDTSGTGTSTGSSTQSGDTVSGVNCSVSVGEKKSTVTWNSQYGAVAYQVLYTNDDTGVSYGPMAYGTSYEFPLGYGNTTKGFTVRIVAYGTMGSLGTSPFAYATYVNNHTNTSGNTGTTTKPADTTPEAPTNFKGTATSKKVALSWNKAKNAETYKVYWRRASSSDWKLAKETTKRALTVSGLNNGMSYQFKVVANGHESGILTISPVASGSDVRTAKDPEGSGTSSNKAPVITSATGSTGSFTVAWDGIANGNLYKVYAHRVGVDVTSDGKQTYYVKATVSATSATVNNLAAGTYQIRIKGSTDNGKTWTELKDCDYYTVTVK